MLSILSFRGRASRGRYLASLLVVPILIGLVDVGNALWPPPPGLTLAQDALMLLSVWVIAAAHARRLADIGWPAAFAALSAGGPLLMLVVAALAPPTLRGPIGAISAAPGGSAAGALAPPWLSAAATLLSHPVVLLLISTLLLALPRSRSAGHPSAEKA